MSDLLRHSFFIGAGVLATFAAVAAPAPSNKANAPTAPAAAVALPQQTTATFGDWTLRCSRPTGTAKFCELAQGAQRDGKAVAEMAIGAAGAGQRLQFTLLVPTSVSFAAVPTLTPPSGDGAGLSLTWRRCLPVGCFADAELGDDALSRMRAWTQPARVVFTDGAGRATTVPVSPLGLSQAMDALAKEDAG